MADAVVSDVVVIDDDETNGTQTAQSLNQLKRSPVWSYFTIKDVNKKD